ncbi:MAG: choice-of-anchor Q domain-containing protein, partial [Steroidobacteraceae bacterium]
VNCQNVDGEIVSYGGNIEDRGDCPMTADRDYQNLDPMLTPLGNHGGPTPTLDVLRGSPAIGWGRDCPVMDQRGFGRATAACTSGAVEYGARKLLR